MELFIGTFGMIQFNQKSDNYPRSLLERYARQKFRPSRNEATAQMSSLEKKHAIWQENLEPKKNQINRFGIHSRQFADADISIKDFGKFRL